LLQEKVPALEGTKNQIMGTLGNGLNLLNVSAFVQRVVMGLIIIGVVVFDQWRRRRFNV